MANQMLFRRYEYKYMLTEQQKAVLMQTLSREMEPDEHGESTICSLYYDTPDMMLARRSVSHPVYKEKLRLRSYGRPSPDTPIFVELKKKYRGITYKRRVEMPEKAAECYLRTGLRTDDSQILREMDYFRSCYPGLAPSAMLSYRREAWYWKENHEVRITFDRDIRWRRDNLRLTAGPGGETILQPGQVLMEMKIPGVMPLWLARLLNENHIYRTHFTKYGSAYAAILKQNQEEISNDSRSVISKCI